MNQIDPQTAKADCRRMLREARRALSASQQQQAAIDLLQHISSLPDLSQLNNIAAYWAADGELNCLPLIRHLRENGCELLLPVIQADKSLRFGLYENDEQLSNNRYGIPEPRLDDGEERIPDCILMPLVGVDKQGRRLGMGGGFYDRTLACLMENGHRPLLIGMAHDCQLCESLPAEDWDISVDWVWTPSGAWRASC